MRAGIIGRRSGTAEVGCTETGTSRDGRADVRRLLCRIDAGGLWLWCKWCRTEHRVSREEVLDALGDEAPE